MLTRAPSREGGYSPRLSATLILQDEFRNGDASRLRRVMPLSAATVIFGARASPAVVFGRAAMLNTGAKQGSASGRFAMRAVAIGAGLLTLRRLSDAGPATGVAPISASAYLSGQAGFDSRHGRNFGARTGGSGGARTREWRQRDRRGGGGAIHAQRRRAAVIGDRRRWIYDDLSGRERPNAGRGFARDGAGRGHPEHVSRCGGPAGPFGARVDQWVRGRRPRDRAWNRGVSWPAGERSRWPMR